MVQSVSNTNTVAHEHLRARSSVPTDCLCSRLILLEYLATRRVQAPGSGSRADGSTCIVELAEPAHSKGSVLSQLSQKATPAGTVLKGTFHCSQVELAEPAHSKGSVVSQLSQPRKGNTSLKGTFHCSQRNLVCFSTTISSINTIGQIRHPERDTFRPAGWKAVCIGGGTLGAGALWRALGVGDVI